MNPVSDQHLQALLLPDLSFNSTTHHASIFLALQPKLRRPIPFPLRGRWIP